MNFDVHLLQVHIHRELHKAECFFRSW